MPNYVGVRFKQSGRLVEVDVGHLSVNKGDSLVVETTAGLRLADVVTNAHPVPRHNGTHPKPIVIRIANNSDLATRSKNEKLESDALRVCAERVKEHALPMKLIDAEFNLDGSQVTINFAADNRIDFRELVRDVASRIKARVIFHQVGVRDHARAICDMGHCGRELCCRTFLHTLDPVTIKMAKDQSLPLNPNKFSGVCGKLMCCLRFEYDCYAACGQQDITLGSRVQTKFGFGKVLRISDVSGIYSVELDDGSIVEEHIGWQSGKWSEDISDNGAHHFGEADIDNEPADFD